MNRYAKQSTSTDQFHEEDTAESLLAQALAPIVDTQTCNRQHRAAPVGSMASQASRLGQVVCEVFPAAGLQRLQQRRDGSVDLCVVVVLQL